MINLFPDCPRVQTFLFLACVTLLAAAPATAQTGSWQVHEGTADRHSFGTTIPNGDLEGFLSGADIPAESGPGWANVSNDLAFRWSGPGGIPCRQQANYTYFQTSLFPASGDRYGIAFVNVDDAARVTVFNQDNPSGVAVPNGLVGLRDNRTVDLTPALLLGATNRVVITLADVCGSGNAIQARLEVEAGAAPAEETAAPSGGTMNVDGTKVRTGPLQVTLEWQGVADLDLAVTDPSGGKVYYNRTRIGSGGLLDVDARGGCPPGADAQTMNVENIVWETAPPSGDYQIEVDHYSHCAGDDGPVQFTLTLRRNGQVLPGWPRTETVAIGAEKTYPHTVR